MNKAYGFDQWVELNLLIIGGSRGIAVFPLRLRIDALSGNLARMCP